MSEILYGDQVPRLLTIPERHVEPVDGCENCAIDDYESGCGDYLAQDAIDFCESVGFNFDPWQKWYLHQMLGTDKTGLWAAMEAALIVSRQNGKGTILEAREIAGMYMLGEKLLIHTAHEFKDVAVTTPILTANRGWTTMGSLVTGDRVYAPDGTVTGLTAHPWIHDSKCYRVKFADGQEFTAGSGHLWEVTEAWLHNGKTERKVVTTQQMYDAGLVHESGSTRSSRKRRIYRWRTDLPAPITGTPLDSPSVDPWLLGAWLGDGTTTGGELTVGDADLKYVLERLDSLGETYSTRQDSRTGAWTVGIYGLRVRLRKLGVLGNKHIPAAYLTASEGQRQGLLAGLMDTDGTVSAHQLVITTIAESLMHEILCLVRSLGYRATIREFRARLNGADAGPMWRVQFAPNGISPFGMQRKTDKILKLRTTRSAYNAIVSIEPVASVPTRCITVDHPSGCYLVGEGFTVTHNTSTEHFRRVVQMIDANPSLRKRLDGRPKASHGEEAIELKPTPTLIWGSGSRQVYRKVGARLRFLARSRGSGRGFSADCLVYDEAMILSEEQVGASMPTMSAQPNPQIIYTASSGLEDSFQLAAVRKRIVKDKKDLFGAEWSIEPHTEECQRDEIKGRESNYYIICDKHDDRDIPESWAKANPAYGYRISERFTAKELSGMPPKQFDVERLGVGDWPVDDEAWSTISEPMWTKLVNEDPGFPTPPLAFGVDIDEDGKSATICAAWTHEESGRTVIEIPRNGARQGTDWILDRLKELYAKRRPVAIAVPKSSPASSLIEDGKKLWRDRFLAIGPGDEAAAFAYFVQQAKEEGLWHFGREKAPTLWHAVGRADTRVVGDGGKTWSRRDSDSDITPVTAATLAVYALNKMHRSYDPLKSVA